MTRSDKTGAAGSAGSTSSDASPTQTVTADPNIDGDGDGSLKAAAVPLDESQHKPQEGDKGGKAAAIATTGRRKDGKPEHWLERTEQTIPQNNLYIVFTGLMLTVFLSALDQTICATALPTISADLRMSSSDYSWVGSAYLLACTAVIPLYGRISDIVGRKPMLWLAMSLFLFGSAMCGAAQSPTWLSVCRGVQGLGGGGTITLANILIGDLVPLKKRGSYAGLYGFVWGLASVCGPILGGVIAQNTSWRWIFFLNLPVGLAAFVVLFFFLHLNPQEKKSAKQYFLQFDLVGYLLVLAAIVVFLLGFTFAETDGFQAPKSIACIIVGAFLFPVFTAYEFWVEKHYTNIKPIVPPRLFRTRTTALIFVLVACHSLSFFAAAYYLPLYYQAVTGSSATLSAVQMLPFSLISSLTSAGAGFLVTYLGRYRPIIWASFAIFTLGMGLMTMMDANTHVALQEIYPGIAGFGLGALFQTPLVALTAAMPPAQMATSVASFALVRTAAGTVGITVAGSIFNSGVLSRVRNIPGYAAMMGSSATHGDLKNLVHLQPPSLARDVVDAYGEALRLVWIVLTPIVGVGLLASLGLKGYSLNRRYTGADGKGKGSETSTGNKDGTHAVHGDVEKQVPQDVNEDRREEEEEEDGLAEDGERKAEISDAIIQGPEVSLAPALPMAEKLCSAEEADSQAAKLQK